MRTKGRFPNGTLLCATILALACSSAQSDSVPKDFKLSAQYAPGYSSWKAWKFVVTADGKASQETYASRSGHETNSLKTFLLATNELQQLFAALQASDFFTLKKDYSYPVTDSPTLSLQLTMNGTSHEVKVYAAHHLKDNRDVKRFLKVWNEVLKTIPSPNAEQKPE